MGPPIGPPLKLCGERSEDGLGLATGTDNDVGELGIFSSSFALIVPNGVALSLGGGVGLFDVGLNLGEATGVVVWFGVGGAGRLSRGGGCGLFIMVGRHASRQTLVNPRYLYLDSTLLTYFIHSTK